MLKLTMMVTRLPALNRAEFDAHWLNVHAPLVRSVAGVLGIRRYIHTVPLTDNGVQHRAEAARGTLPVGFDGMGELWWDDLDSHLAARQTPEGREALGLLVADERRFVDLPRSILWYGTERGIITPNDSR